MERSFQSQDESTEDRILAGGTKARQSKEQELARISPLFRKLDAEAQAPGPREWKAFSNDLAARLEEESRKRGAIRFAESLRDVYTATDSTGLRILIIICAVFALAGIAAAFWLATLFILDATAEGITFALDPARTTVTRQMQVEAQPFIRIA